MLTLLVYDPNDPDNDTVKLSLSLANPVHTTDVSYSATIFGGDKKIWSFFRTVYSPVIPPSSLNPTPNPPPAPTPTIPSPLTGDGRDIVIAQVIRNSASGPDKVAVRLTSAANIL